MSNSSNDDGCGCLLAILFIVGGLILGIFFPSTRGGVIVQPIKIIWEDLLGIPLPSYNIGPIVIKAVLLIIIVIITFLIGIALGKIFKRIFNDYDLDLQWWGAISSIIGLIIGIVSLFVEFPRIKIGK